jgi:hypothetical protein
MARGKFEGNSVGEIAALQANLLRLGSAIFKFEGSRLRAEERDMYVTQLRIRFPTVQGGEYLAVLSAHHDGVFVVAFHSAGTFADAIVGMLNRLENGDLQWKEDSYKK